MTTEALVRPSNIQEQLLGKIRDMRQNNLTAKQKKDIDMYEKQLVNGFRIFSWKYFGVSQEQILELTDEEIEALFSLVYSRARKTSIYMTVIGVCIPIFGWAIILPESESISFTSSVRKLNKMLGNGFSTAKTIRTRLGQ